VVGVMSSPPSANCTNPRRSTPVHPRGRKTIRVRPVLPGVLTYPETRMHPVAPETVLDQLRWRYATKQFDPARKIPSELWAKLEQAAVLAPSSYGLQPWKFVVVTDPAVRKKLHPASWNQAQILDASHLVVFAAKNPPTPVDVEQYVARIAEIRGVPVASVDAFKLM